ncbi:MAG: hypothetical protein IPM33_05005 [Phycisphaerales bacterium]|nr:hypothetical protein [Phycisphaerales bacterium]
MGRTYVCLKFDAPLAGSSSPLGVCVLIPTTKPEQPAFCPRTTRMLARIADLTPREREVLALIGQGKRSKQIALHINRSVRTVHGHTAAISRKLGSATRAEMVRIALLSGLVSQATPAN